MTGRGRLSGLGVGVACCALAACGVFDDGPPLSTKQELPAAFKQADAATAKLPPPQSAWWKEFNDRELDRLVGTGLANNHDVKVAISRITQADAQARAVGAAQYPTLDADVRTTDTAPAGGLGTAISPTPWMGQRLPQAGLTTAYEVDLWGKNASAADSALALAEASVQYREVVGLTLTADIAKTYFDYLSENDRLAVAESNVATVRASLQAVRTRMDQGDATINEVLQQETSLETAEATVPVHRLNRDRAFDKLAALLGTTPAQLSLSGKTLAGIAVPKVGPGIPASLICRRPDIRRAEADMLSAHADIAVARAKMYPTLSFSVGGGVSAYSFAGMINTLPQSRFYSLIGDLTQSIFDAGKNAAVVQQQKARYEEMIETYRQTIIESVHDVEDALAAVRQFGQQQQALARAAATARKAHDLTTVSFERGAVDYLLLLESERSLNTTEDAEIAARDDRLKAAVDLFKALGGGLDDPHC